jgi:hypothetical protein
MAASSTKFTSLAGSLWFQAKDHTSGIRPDNGFCPVVSQSLCSDSSQRRFPESIDSRLAEHLGDNQFSAIDCILQADPRRFVRKCSDQRVCSDCSSPGFWRATTFAGKRIADAVVDLPFALPTAVAGLSLTALYAPNGWFGSVLAKFGIQVAYTKLGVLVALVFVGLPFRRKKRSARTRRL